MLVGGPERRMQLKLQTCEGKEVTGWQKKLEKAFSLVKVS